MGLRRNFALAAVRYGIHTEDWDEALSFLIALPQARHQSSQTAA